MGDIDDNDGGNLGRCILFERWRWRRPLYLVTPLSVSNSNFARRQEEHGLRCAAMISIARLLPRLVLSILDPYTRLRWCTYCSLQWALQKLVGCVLGIRRIVALPLAFLFSSLPIGPPRSAWAPCGGEVLRGNEATPVSSRRSRAQSAAGRVFLL